MAIQITIENGVYALRFPYNAKLVAAIKSLPKQHRAWNGNAWLIAPEAILKAKAAIVACGYPEPDIPPFETSQAITQAIQKQFTVKYVGQCKDRDGQSSALGLVGEYWEIEFPETVLRDWFENREKQATTDGKQTLYQALCVFESASDSEIKSAYRRLARQWHPDVCSEPEAPEKFRELTDAYEVLMKPEMRRRYDAGLYFERQVPKSQEYSSLRKSRFANNNYRAPLRCGLITCEGVQRLSRFVVGKILDWQDITDGQGRVMSASWNKHTESIEIKWI